MMDEGRNEEFEAEVVEAEANEMEQTEPALVLGDDDPRDAGLHERILSEEQAWKGKFLDVRSAQVELPNGRIAGRDLVRIRVPPPWLRSPQAARLCWCVSIARRLIA